MEIQTAPFKKGTWRTYTRMDGLAHDQVVGIHETKDGVMWFATYGGGVSRWDGRQFANYTMADGLVSDAVWQVAQDKAGALWFGTQSNQTSLAPEIVVASQVYHWEGIVKEMVDSIKAGTYGGKTFTANLANGGEVIEFNPDYKLPADAQALADKTIAGIKDGSIKVELP